MSTEFVNVPVPADRVEEVYRLLATRTIELAPGVTLTGTEAEIAQYKAGAPAFPVASTSFTARVGGRYQVVQSIQSIRGRRRSYGFIGTVSRLDSARHPGLVFRDLAPIPGYRISAQRALPTYKSVNRQDVVSITAV